MKETMWTGSLSTALMYRSYVMLPTLSQMWKPSGQALFMTDEFFVNVHWAQNLDMESSLATCLVIGGIHVYPICLPLTLTLNRAHSSDIIWLIAGQEPELKWLSECLRPGSSAFKDSGSPQKGHVTLLWHVWFFTTLPQLGENTVLLNQTSAVIQTMNILTLPRTDKMEEQSETPYVTIISFDPSPQHVERRINRFFVQLALLVACISCTQSINKYIIMLFKHWNNSSISDHFTHP